MKNLKTLEKQFAELNNRIELTDYFENLINFEDIDENTDFQDIYNMVDEKGGFNVEIIYYSEAIKYLSKNDPSLKESFEIAKEYGYTIDNLNSEILATIHCQNEIRDEFSELENEINEILTDFFN